ncbi:MAG: GAF domain-containing protein [Anaerolineae bacterium]|nr:GAF domain-containing protein [Anaerolineae bacterium]
MSRFFLTGLRGRLLLLVLLAVIPIVGLTLYTNIELRRLVVADVKQETLRLARFAVSSQEDTIKDTRQLLFALSQLSEVHEADAAACSVLFAQLLRQYPQYAQLGVVAQDGHVFCSALPDDSQLNIADQAFFQRTLQTGAFTLSDYQDYQSEPISGKATLSFGYPVLSEAGQVEAVVFASLDLAWLNQLAAQAQLPEGSTFTVIDRNGTILVRYPDPGHWVGRTVPESPIVKIIRSEGDEGTVEAVGVDGTQRQYAFTPLQITPEERDVFVSVGIPTPLAFANANRVLTQNLIVLGLVTLLTLAAAWYGSDVFVLRQVNGLVAATKQLSAGNLMIRTGLPYKHGELGQLAEAFDEMAGSLERRVLERDQAERALQESQRAMATLLSNLPGMAYRSYTDASRTMQFVSEGCLDLTGYAPAELTENGKITYGQLIHPDDRTSVWDRMQAALQGTEPFQLIYRITTAANTEKWVWEQGRGVFSVKGRLIAIEGFVTDTTERVQAYQMLEQRVADRTRELSALYEVTAVASASLNLTTTLERSLEQVLTVMQGELGTIYLLDPAQQVLRLAAWQGLPANLMDEMVALAPGRDLASWIIEHGEPLVVPHLASDPRASKLVLTGTAQAFVGAPMRSRGRVLGVLGVIGAAGRQFEMEEVALLASIADEVGVAVENAQLYEAERIQRHQADTLLQVASVVSSTLELNEVLARILDQLRRVVNYDSASVQLLEEGQLHVIAARGFADLQQVLGMTFAPHEVPYYRVVAEGQALNLADAPKLYPSLHRTPFSHIRSWLGVPLQVQERMIGIIAVDRQLPGGFAEEEVRLTTAFADQAALALENARLYQQAEQLAVMEERSRLARELHDSVTQSLYSLTLFAEAGRRAAEAGEKERELGYLTRLGQVSHQALKEMRLLVYELRTAALEKEGLVAALQQRLDAVEKRAGVQARLLVEETVELPAMVEEGLYRIAQEALNNILKHAQATSVIVRLKANSDQVELEVTDNGRAFEATSLSNGGGIGLTSMRERAERLGGSLTIISKPGEGTRVIAQVPARRGWSRPTLPIEKLTEVLQ